MAHQCERDCLVCGKRFDYPPSEDRQYCSFKCYHRGRTLAKTEPRNCRACGKEFRTPKADPRPHCSSECTKATHEAKWTESVCPICNTTFPHLKVAPRLYCSRPCHMRAREMGKHETRACLICQRVFTTLTNGPQKYCSKVCSGKGNVKNFPGFQPTRFTAQCEQCGTSFVTYPAKGANRFCSIRCHSAWRSLHLRGESHHAYGKKKGRSKHLPPPTTLECIICGSAFVVTPSIAEKRICCSRKCRAIWFARTVSGERHYNWSGGKVNWRGASWQEARRQALLRDVVCQDCGISPEELGRQLHVHHIIPFRFFGVERHLEANALTNLICYCCRCHRKHERAADRERKRLAKLASEGSA